MLRPMQFDHIGVVTRTLAEGRQHLGALLSLATWTQEFTDPLNGVQVQFGRDGSCLCYELVAPYGAASPVAGALASGRNILNHVAYRVVDLAAAAETIRAAGGVPVGEPRPAVAYNGACIQFFMTPLQMIIELIEAPDHGHVFARD